MKKMSRLFASILVIAMLFSTAVCFAEGTTGFSLGDGDVNPRAPGNAAQTAATIIGFLRWIGYAIAVGMLVFIGIKYVMASANEKADLKNSLIRYVIGAILIAGAVTIAGWVFDIVQ